MTGPKISDYDRTVKLREALQAALAPGAANSKSPAIRELVAARDRNYLETTLGKVMRALGEA